MEAKQIKNKKEELKKIIDQMDEKTIDELLIILHKRNQTP